MPLNDPALDVTPIPADVIYFGSLADRVYYYYDGAIWAWTPCAWYGVCLISDWPHRPEALALANQDRSRITPPQLSFKECAM